MHLAIDGIQHAGRARRQADPAQGNGDDLRARQGNGLPRLFDGFELERLVEVTRHHFLPTSEPVRIVEAQRHQYALSHLSMRCEACRFAAHIFGTELRQPIESLGAIKSGDRCDLVDPAGKAIEYETTVAPRRPPGEPLCFKQDDALAASLELQRRRKPGKPAAHYAHVGLDRAAEARHRLSARSRRFIPGFGFSGLKCHELS